MEASRRDEFIRRYHLVSLSTDLGVRLAAQSDATGRLTGFAVTLTNGSAEALRIPNWKAEQGIPLLFRSAGRRYLWGHDIPRREFERQYGSQVSLVPGASADISLPIEITHGTQAPWWRLGIPRTTRLVLATPIAAHAVVPGEELVVCALLEVTALDARGGRADQGSRSWIGRLVSNPVTVRISAP
jgi:hypothetical protein